jgi:uncharacterized protein (TIGR03067 family)
MPETEDLDALQGSWSIHSLITEGQTLAASVFTNAGIVINGNRFTSLGMGTSYEGTLELDSTKNPRHLNMSFDVGPEAGNVNLCIYELTANFWKLCIATRGSLRPTTFASTPGSGVVLEILKHMSA